MTQTRSKAPGEKADHLHSRLGISDEEIRDFYWKMALARTFDERVWALNRQGQVPIAASGQGQEGAQLGSLLAAHKDGDCFLFPYYRDLALKLSNGLSVLEAMLSYTGRQGGAYSGGRQFPLQGAHLEGKLIQLSNVVAAGMTQSVGFALACRMRGEDTVVLSYFGDGATSEGECHEAMNFAGIHRLPVVFICENNRYAISVPQSKQMAVEDIAFRAEGYGLLGRVVDGMDFLTAFEAARDAIVHARSVGPVLLEMKVERFMPHTTDDDDRRYRPKEEVESVRNRDPLHILRDYLMESGLMTAQQDDEIQAKALEQVDQATEQALAAPLPDPATINDNLFAP